MNASTEPQWTRLLNKQKNDVFERVKQGGLDPLGFEWVDRKNAHNVQYSVLRLRSEPSFYFDFDYTDHFRPHCSPWHDRREVRLSTASWIEVLNYVNAWIQSLKNELNTPDPWNALSDYTEISGVRVAPNSVNTQFTVPEAEKVAHAIEDIRKLLLNHVGSATAQAAAVNDQLNSLLESSKKMGRKDWFNLAIGALITLAMNIALPPEITKQAFEILKASLTGIVHLLPPILASAQQLTG